MKVHSKMVVSSSPGRPEKLVGPPFTKLLRWKDGSRSRGRSLSHSRSSPMFVVQRRGSKGSKSATAVEIQEQKDPGSPKVTCIGQVRIKKMKKKKVNSLDSSQKEAKHWQCCGCRGDILGNPFSKMKSTVVPTWRRWLSSSCSGSYQKQLRKEDDCGGGSVGNESLDKVEWSRAEKVEKKEETELPEEAEVFVATTPPKNALLLMRCRSAPHRSSALIAAVTGQNEMNPIGGIAGKARAEGDGGSDKDNVINLESKEVSCHDGSSREEEEEDEAAAAAVGPSPSFSSRPLILTRCKSEPARKAAKLATPENSSCFWGSNNGNRDNNDKNKWLALAEEKFPPSFPK